jgi:hypothetical protein
MNSKESRIERSDLPNDSPIEEHVQPSESKVKVKTNSTDSRPANTTAHAVSPTATSLTSNLEQEIINKIVSAYGNTIEVIYVRPSRMKISVPPQDILRVATFIKENFSYDHAESVAGTD